jgi:hypothetical protein
LSSALALLVFGGEIGGPLGCCDGDRDCRKAFGDGEPLPLSCGEGMSGRLRGTWFRDESIESGRPGFLRGESIAPDGRKESDGCFDMSQLREEIPVDRREVIVVLMCGE